ncbi:MAG: hypothetical protein P1Q69_20630, partial [Candidatus Thorarchaeota archaeon]|nr:hypothetical protein [Candidatus Thorarchaeota archaeon]
SRNRGLMKLRKERGIAQSNNTLLTCTSVFGGAVVLNKETMDHIKDRHPEVLQLPNLFVEIITTIEDPEFIAEGRTNEVVALRRIPDTHKFLAVFYIEGSRIKTIFITSKPDSFKRRGVIWPK